MRNDRGYTKLYWGDSDDRRLLVERLRASEVAISSTDTIDGFLGNTTAESYDRICKLKQLSHPRPFLVLIGSIEMLSRFVVLENFSNRIIGLLVACWPGPLTVIFKAKPGVPGFLTSAEGTIAIRCPDHAGLQAILTEFDALFSTSANRSGEKPPKKLSEISSEILREVSCVMIDVGEEDVVKTKPSTIIDFSSIDYGTLYDKDLPFKVVREGVYSIQTLKDIYEKIEND